MLKTNEPSFDRIIRRRLVSFFWFPLRDYSEEQEKKLEKNLKWLVEQPGFIGSTWHYRKVWKNHDDAYTFWGFIPQRVIDQWRRNPLCCVDAVNESHRRGPRVRLRLSSGSSKWISLKDFVHMWRLVSWAKLPSLPKGVKRKRIPVAIASVHV